MGFSSIWRKHELNFFVSYLYDPVSKGKLPVEFKMDGGGFIHINKYHKLYKELITFPDRLEKIPFHTKDHKRKNKYIVQAHVTGLNGRRKGNELIYGGIYFTEYTDNLMHMKMIGQRRRLYGIR